MPSVYHFLSSGQTFISSHFYCKCIFFQYIVSLTLYNMLWQLRSTTGHFPWCDTAQLLRLNSSTYWSPIRGLFLWLSELTTADSQSPETSSVATSYWLSQRQQGFNEVGSLWRQSKICTPSISTKRSLKTLYSSFRDWDHPPLYVSDQFELLL